MRLLTVIGHNVYPWQDILVALANAGAEVCWVKSDKLPQIASSPFDVVLADHHSIAHLGTVALNCRTLMLVQMDSVFYEAPMILDLLKNPNYGGAINVTYWAACEKSGAFMRRHLPKLACFTQRYPFQDRYTVSLPEGFLCPPGRIGDHLTNPAPWLASMKPAVDLTDRVFFAGGYDSFATPTLGWTDSGPIDARDLDEMMRKASTADGIPPVKIDCMSALLASKDLDYVQHAALFKGYYQHVVKRQAVDERGPLVKRIGEALGERFHLMGDDWAALGVRHHPSSFGSSVDTAAYYNRARLSLDLGSSQLDIGWYQRPMEIVRYGGRLLQLKQYDSAEIFGPVADLVVCASADRMVERLAESRTTTEDERQAVVRHLASAFDSTAIGTRVFEWLARQHPAAGTRAARSPKDEIAHAKAALAAGDIQGAVAAAQQILANRPNDAPAIHLMGLVAERVGQLETANQMLRAAATIDARSAEFHNDLGRVLLALGRSDEAAVCFRTTLSLSPLYPNAHAQLSMATLPGDPYHEILRRTHLALRPKTYVEIGIMYGDSLALARPPTRAIGIDPEPIVQHRFEAPTTVYPLTSDAFFDQVPMLDAIGSDHFEMAFIDGLHTFDQTLRDFINLERHAKKNSIVFIHDCIPLDAATATRTQNTEFWSGDTWKIIPILKRYRPDLAVRVIATCPTGLAVVTNLDPNSRILDREWPNIVSEYMSLGDDYLDEDRTGKLNIFPNDWAKIEQVLRDTRNLESAAPR